MLMYVYTSIYMSPYENFLELLKHSSYRGTWWCIGWGDDFQPEGRGLDSRSCRHVGTMGIYLQLPVRFCVKFRYSIWAVVGNASE